MLKKKMILKSVVIMIFTFLLVTFIPTYAFACSCEPISAKKRVKLMKKGADAIFVGTVKEIFSENPEFGGTLINKVVLTVEKSWKAKETKEYTIYMSGGCRVWFEKGKSYLVYAKMNEKNQLTTEICMGTGEVILSNKDLRLLSKPVWVNTN